VCLGLLPERGGNSHRFLQRLKRDSDSGRATAAVGVAELRPAGKSIRWVAVAGATILVIGMAVGGWLIFSRKANAPTDTDTIVLADFVNKTGDPIFDDTLRPKLAAQLQQSPFLSLVSDQEILVQSYPSSDYTEPLRGTRSGLEDRMRIEIVHCPT
jgi:hypothetical protein